MSMLIGYIHNGEAYLASDEMATEHDLETGVAKRYIEIGEKIVVINDYTLVSVCGICTALEAFQHLFSKKKRCNDMDIQSFLKETVDLCRGIMGSFSNEEAELRKNMQLGGTNVIVAHYDKKKKCPCLYGFNDYDNYKIKEISQDTGMMAKSALPDELMWTILKNIKAGSVEEYMKMAFMAVNNMTESVSETFDLYKVGKKGVIKL